MDVLGPGLSKRQFSGRRQTGCVSIISLSMYTAPFCQRISQHLTKLPQQEINTDVYVRHDFDEFFFVCVPSRAA
jgi:hypothetical protein